MSNHPPRVDWHKARADSPVHAAWREGKVHPDAVNEWLWIVAPVPFGGDWWPALAFRVYSGFGGALPLQSSALSTVEDWQPVIPGTPKGDQCLDLVRRLAPTIRPIDPDNEAKYFTFSGKPGGVRGDEG